MQVVFGKSWILRRKFRQFGWAIAMCRDGVQAFLRVCECRRRTPSGMNSAPAASGVLLDRAQRAGATFATPFSASTRRTVATET